MMDLAIPRKRSVQAPLYQPSYEHDACGTGFVADLSGKPSHAIVAQGLEAVVNLTHRGAVDADAKTGDGSGILIQTPRRLLVREAARLTGRGFDPDGIAAGMIFLPSSDTEAAELCRSLLNEALARQNVPVLAWRAVPVQADTLGDKARETMPEIQQVIVAKPPGLEVFGFERRLYLARKQVERAVAEVGIAGFHVASLSSRTLVYKGLLVARDLATFFDDLRDPDCESALAVFHQRYSTNTFPTWSLAQPFRFLGHNGEINTLQGNRNWMTAREPELAADVWGNQVADIVPIIDPDGSDSANLDNVLELLELSGRDLLHAAAMLVPEAWENMPTMDPALRAFYAYHATLMEPWDGPAALAFSNGTIAGAVLDRNGLRPSRYSVTDDGLVVLASETGVLDLSNRRVVERGRLGPGQMLAVDVEAGKIWRNDEIKAHLAARQPYQEWVKAGFRSLSGAPAASNGHEPDAAELMAQQVSLGFTGEDLRLVIQPMVADAKEPLWSMGDDAPLAVLSAFPRPLASLFRQRFAQVTNPPIDPLRESLVMALDVYLGPRHSMLVETPKHAQVLHLSSPVLLEGDLDALKALHTQGLTVSTLAATFPAEGGPAALETALDRLVAEAEQAIDAGTTVLILSDRAIDAEHAPIPMPLAVGAVHHHLIKAGKRPRASIVCEAGDVWDVHQACVVIGYGASAIHPYLGLTVARRQAGTRGFEEFTADELAARYRKSLDAGILKVMSKMGISAVASYQGAQLFEILGLDQSVVDRFFVGTPSRLGGLDLNGIAERALQRHQQAFSRPMKKLPEPGMIRFRREGEYHAFSPANVRALQKAVASGDVADYSTFVEMVQSRQPAFLRDLITFRPSTSIPIEEVESAEEIRQRFIVTAMSLGAISPEAFRTLAIGMNRIGARSNSGEGGEDRDWYYEPGPDIAHSRIKQVASARFGVSAEYLSRATELEIKMAQGSKPGEGGQLPAHKVTALIARLRHAVPGISLISPPPHHDIYSIEDLAQLIYDLHQVNPRARVGVKLVSEAGVGTIAAGVAKAHADYILISGHSGGTGASPLSSIKHAGVPWELGLAETQQTLVLNDLRGRVHLRTDGGLQTARDVVIAAMIGAEEYGFGTSALVSIGCDMARQCHLNTCPTGIATQREDLRAKFSGTPEGVITYFTRLAEEVRELLARLGVRRLTDIVGRVDLLKQLDEVEGPGATLDLSAILTVPGGPDAIRISASDRNHFADGAGPSLDDEMLPEAMPALERGEPVRIERAVRNHHRSVGARLAGEVGHRYGLEGLPPGTIEVRLNGVAGQSFGVWCTNGLRLILDGEANDYVGKGMSGGEIIIRPSGESLDPNRQQVALGNTVLYGAIGGELYAAGEVGERFAVRNSGATAVVEGVGDHGCEYMTGGMVVVLGQTGRNFAAGMTNGTAYVLDELEQFPTRYNPELVDIQRISDPESAEILLALIERHVALTGSRRGRAVLDNWSAYLPRFWQVVPRAVPVSTGEPVEQAAERVAD
ncbi:glutamate synthase large subunit [Nitrolancea hollandica]|uniref:Glutamate synthase [NADPH] large chain n=1 Tax=Nitrolancea hollandica Lb TaxID=1129897 RepID=I4EDQ2_9BACT|nr:glutamate synthase large subunit [Nitrolancea hollandica]CCF82814.1 Ferredoxin-dependent glutamate synthase 1 [Nitrolancea hollandica Lb]